MQAEVLRVLYLEVLTAQVLRFMAQIKITPHSHCFFWVLDVNDVGKVMALVRHLNSVGKSCKNSCICKSQQNMSVTPGSERRSQYVIENKSCFTKQGVYPRPNSSMCLFWFAHSHLSSVFASFSPLFLVPVVTAGFVVQ